MVLGVIAGSSLLKSQIFSILTVKIVETPFGATKIFTNDDNSLVFCQRHAASTELDYSPPHMINHRAIVSAFHQLNVTHVIGFCSVGSLHNGIVPGTLVIPDDYVNFWNLMSLYDDDRGHIVPQYDSTLRNRIITLINDSGLHPLDQGTYVQTKGPRFETKAEIKVISLMGHLAGMTGAHEATLSQEIGLRYASICMVDNFANGINARPTLTREEFDAGIKRNLTTVEKVAALVIASANELMKE